MTEKDFNYLTEENIHTQFHINLFENEPEKIYCIKDIQIVHKRRVSKRLYFFDARFYKNTNDICKTCQKVSFILKYPELEIDNIHNIQKSVKLGDKVRIICWVENMTKRNELESSNENENNTIDNNILFHIKEVEIIEKYDSKIAFVPELPIKEKRNKNIQRNDNENKKISNNEDEKKLKNENIGNTKEKIGICKFWLNGKNCLRGDDCPFRHITNEELKKQWIDEVFIYI